MKRLRKLTDSLPSLLEEGEEEESENQHVTFQNDQDVCEPIKDKITNGEKPRSRQTRKQRVQKYENETHDEAETYYFEGGKEKKPRSRSKSQEGREKEGREKDRKKANVYTVKSNTYIKHSEGTGLEYLISKYPDEKSESSAHASLLPAEKTAEKKNDLKIKNRLFSDLYTQSCEPLPKESLEELIVKRKDLRYSRSNLIDKIDQKVHGFRNRMDNKRTDKSRHFKLQVHSNIYSVKDAEMVEVVVELPNTINGNSAHTSAALYLRNTQDLPDNTTDNEPEQKEQDKDKQDKDKQDKDKQDKDKQDKDKKTLFTKKIYKITSSDIKRCFKKSTLDYDDFLEVGYFFEECSNSIGEISCKTKRKSEELQRVESRSRSINGQNSQINSIYSNSNIYHNKSYPLEAGKYNSKFKTLTEAEKIKIVKKLSKVARRIEARKAKQKKAKRPTEYYKKAYYRAFFEEEAEESGDEGEDDEYEEEFEGVALDQDLIDLIDNAPELKDENEVLVYRKFVEDMRLQDDRLIERIKTGLYGGLKRTYTDSERRTRKRMELIRKKNLYEYAEADMLPIPAPKNEEKEETDRKERSLYESLSLLKEQIGVDQDIRPRPIPKIVKSTVWTDINLLPAKELKRNQRGGLIGRSNKKPSRSSASKRKLSKKPINVYLLSGMNDNAS